MKYAKNLSIPDLISHGLCIGCGNCAAVNPKYFSIIENEYGLLQAKVENEEITYDNTDICPFLNTKNNEDYFNIKYESQSSDYSPEIGFFRNVFAGYVNNENLRIASSSGGLVSYLIEELFQRKLITGAIVVANDPATNGRLKYTIARNKRELDSSRKSKYHMVSHESAITQIIESNTEERLIYVGIPCGVKAIKLLCEKIPRLKESIVYTAAIFCGHQKSHAFSEFVAWQMGLHPSHLMEINYRLKKPENDASRYFYRVSSYSNSYERRVDNLKWMDWGLGLFKPKACDFCDDVTGETADIIFGDAWHRKYAKDYRGTNLVITRSVELEAILLDGRTSGTITLFNEKKSLIQATQGGNFRHRHEGLLSRLQLYKNEKLIAPPKEPIRLSKYRKNQNRHRVYEIRHRISLSSHKAFYKAKKENNLKIFFNELQPTIEEYYRETRKHKSLIINFIKKILNKFK